MEGHAKKCVKRYCDLASRTTQQLHKVSISCIEDHQFQEEQLKSVGECSKVCSQIVLTCSYLARIGRPVIPWSVKKLARYNHKMDPSLWQTIISFDLLLSPDMWLQTKLLCGKTLPNNVDWDCFKTPAGDLEDSKFTSGGTLCILGSHTFLPISWMCKKQTSVSRSSTESEINSLDAGIRLDGIPALDLWDLIVPFFAKNTHQNDQVQGNLFSSPTRKKNSWKDCWSKQCWIYFIEPELFS